MATTSPDGIGEFLADVVRAAAAGETYDADRMLNTLTLVQAREAVAVMTEITRKLVDIEHELFAG